MKLNLNETNVSKLFIERKVIIFHREYHSIFIQRDPNISLMILNFSLIVHNFSNSTPCESLKENCPWLEQKL